MSSPDLAGASEQKAEYWGRKITSLYMNRVQNVFRMITQLGIVADAVNSFRQGNFGVMCFCTE